VLVPRNKAVKIRTPRSSLKSPALTRMDDGIRHSGCDRHKGKHHVARTRVPPVTRLSGCKTMRLKCFCDALLFRDVANRSSCERLVLQGCPTTAKHRNKRPKIVDGPHKQPMKNRKSKQMNNIPKTLMIAAAAWSLAGPAMAQVTSITPG